MIDQYDIRIEDLPDGYRPVAEAIGLDAALTLVAAMGGEAVYVPKADKVCRPARNRAIRREFTGANYSELARRHNLTVVMIRQITGEKDPGARPDTEIRQRPLFD